MKYKFNINIFCFFGILMTFFSYSSKAYYTNSTLYPSHFSLADSIVRETIAEACLVKMVKSKGDDFTLIDLLLKQESEEGKPIKKLVEADGRSILLLVINYKGPIQLEGQKGVKEQNIEVSGLFRAFDKPVQDLLANSYKCKKIKVRFRTFDSTNIHIKAGKKWFSAPYLVKPVPANLGK